jgi:hypothetical protein
MIGGSFENILDNTQNVIYENIVDDPNPPNRHYDKVFMNVAICLLLIFFYYVLYKYLEH